MNLRKATIEELKTEYDRLRLLITSEKDYRPIAAQREAIVKEVRRRGLNPHDVL